MRKTIAILTAAAALAVAAPAAADDYVEPSVDVSGSCDGVITFVVSGDVDSFMLFWEDQLRAQGPTTDGARFKLLPPRFGAVGEEVTFSTETGGGTHHNRGDHTLVAVGRLSAASATMNCGEYDLDFEIALNDPDANAEPEADIIDAIAWPVIDDSDIVRPKPAERTVETVTPIRQLHQPYAI